MRSASATALVDRLEAVGHVERRPHPTDQRLVVEPTRRAVEELDVIRPLAAGLDAIAEGLTLDERRAVARYLERVSEAMGSYGPES